MGLTYALQSLNVDLVQLIRFVHLIHQFLELAIRFLKLCLLSGLVYFDLLGFDVLLMHLFFLEVNDVLKPSFLPLILGEQRLGFVDAALLHSLDRMRQVLHLVDYRSLEDIEDCLGTIRTQVFSPIDGLQVFLEYRAIFCLHLRYQVRLYVFCFADADRRYIAVNNLLEVLKTQAATDLLILLEDGLEESSDPLFYLIRQLYKIPTVYDRTKLFIKVLVCGLDHP